VDKEENGRERNVKMECCKKLMNDAFLSLEKSTFFTSQPTSFSRKTGENKEKKNGHLQEWLRNRADPRFQYERQGSLELMCNSTILFITETLGDKFRELLIC
jgi:hypothetical protein